MAATIPIPLPESLLAMPHPKQNPLKTVMHVSPLMLSEPLLLESIEHSAHKEDDLEDLHFCEDEQPLSPSIELDRCPSGSQNIAPNSPNESLFKDTMKEE